VNLFRFVPSLYGRLALVFTLGFTVLLSGILCWSDYVETTARQQAEQKLHLGLASYVVADNPMLKNGRVDHAALANAMRSLMVLGPNFEFYLLGADGGVLTYSGPVDALKRRHVRLEPILTLIKTPTFLPQLADDPRSEDQQQIFSVAPIINEGVLKGFLYVVIGSQQAQALKQPLLATWKSQQIGLIFILSGLFLLLSLLILFGYITKPLRILQQDIRLVMAENFLVPPVIEDRFSGLALHNSTDEIRQLYRDFSGCMHQISQQMQQLQQLEQQRKMLFADLSHDLRTPLMALHGQLEQLSEQADRSDLAVVNLALARSRQLQRLVEQIFELALLEATEVPLQVETVCLNELLHDIAASYKALAEVKQIQLQLDCPEEHCIISTDIGKLERIIVNLLDNAIRHTAQGGWVQVNISAQAQGYQLQVLDNGCGIHPDDLPHLFTPRFRARNSINDHQAHHGLGLAISSKLCQRLGISFSVHSQLGGGADFTLIWPNVVSLGRNGGL
jgi:signal transduction histidine kinase